MIQRTLLSLIVTVFLFTVMGTASASPVYLPSGSNLSYGYTNHGQMVVSYINNPAAAATAREYNDDVNSYQMGLLTFGVGAEFGAVDDLFTNLDLQIDALQNSTIPSTVTTVAEVDAQVSGLVNGLNNILTEIDNKGYAKLYASFHLPVTPLLIAADLLGGSWTFDANFSATTRAGVIHQDIVFISALDATDDINVAIPTGSNEPITINSDTTILARAAVVGEISLGYGTRLFSSPLGDFYLGVRGKYYRVGLTQESQRLGDLVNGSENTFDTIGDKEFTDSTGFGIDAGVLILMKNLQLGASLTNINEPSFEYNPIDFTGYDLNRPAAQRLQQLSNYVMKQQVKLEVSLHSESKLFALNASLDGNAVEDPFGDEYQWATANISFNINSWFIPDLRVGYRANLAGTELSYATLGLSAFKVLTLDAAYGLEEVTIDGETSPRSFAVNLSLQLSF